jgi:predicted Zn-dependent protease
MARVVSARPAGGSVGRRAGARRAAGLAFLAAVFALACTPRRPPAMSEEASGFGDADLLAIATRIDRDIVGAGMVFPDDGLERYLTGVVRRIAPAEADAISVRVLRDPTANAFALPNGSIWVNVGLLAHLADESQLAFVLAHEVAHLHRRHSMAAVRDRESTKLVSQLAALVVAPIGLADPAARGLYGHMVAGYGRDREVEADGDAFDRMTSAGYPVATLPALFDAMDALEDDGGGTLYNDHPSNAARKAAVEARLREGAPAPSTSADQTAFRSATRGAGVESVRLVLERGHTREALRDAETRLAADPKNARLHVLRGEALRRLASGADAERSLAEAAAAYERALALDPSVAEAHRGLGYVALQRGDRAVARRELERYLTQAPQAADRRFVQALIAQELAP